MAATSPTESDRLEALRQLLVGVGEGHSVNDIIASVGQLHVRNNTFPGEATMGLAADALQLADISRAAPIDHEHLLSSYLPEVTFKGKERQRIQYAVVTAFAVRGGLEPDLLDEVAYWIESYWIYATYAAIAIIRACANQRGIPLDVFVVELGAQHDIDLN